MTTVAERHFRVGELAKLWRLSRKTIARLFRDEPGVLKIGTRRRKIGRPYMVLVIPESVASRVKARLCSNE
jgi:hypothetical protein